MTTLSRIWHWFTDPPQPYLPVEPPPDRPGPFPDIDVADSWGDV